MLRYPLTMPERQGKFYSQTTDDKRDVRSVLRLTLGPPPRPLTVVPRRSSMPRRRRPRAEQPESTDPVSLSSDEMHGHRLRGAAARSAVAGTGPGRPRSQGDNNNGQARIQRRKREDRGGGGREAKTWRGRLEEGNGVDQNKDRGSEKGPSVSSGKKFEDLDNYLRGCASASAAKRKKRKRGLGQGSRGGDSCGGTLTDGSSLSLAEGHEVWIDS